MFGIDTLTASHTGGVVSGQPCDVGAHRRNSFNELLDRMVVRQAPGCPRLRPGRLGATARFWGSPADLQSNELCGLPGASFTGRIANKSMQTERAVVAKERMMTNLFEVT